MAIGLRPHCSRSWGLVAVPRRDALPMSTTGEPGVKMGDSYPQVLAVVSRNNTVTEEVKGEGFRAEGYSPTFKDCRIKYFIFQGANGLQRVSFEPAPQLSVTQNCRQP